MLKKDYFAVDETDAPLATSAPHSNELGWKKTFLSGVIAAGVLLTPGMAAAPLFAASEMAPAAQATATNDWQELEPGASHVVKVKYDAFEKDGRLASEAIVELEMGRRGSVAFDVYTATQYADFEAGKDVTPIGRGNLKSDQTGNPFHDTKLIWANRTDMSETFFIRVENKSTGVSSFHLSVSGNGTTIQNEMADNEMVDNEMAPADVQPAQSVARSSVAETKAELAESSASASDAGYGPESAISAASTTGTLAAGETRWHTFKYDYDHSSNKPAKQATVQVKMDEKESVSFEIWTPAQVKSWAQGDKVYELGAGSVFNDVDTTLIWVGSAKASDRYYVLVENQTDSPANYSLEISGTTVSY